MSTKRLRADLNLTVIQLAMILGVNSATVSRWESSTRPKIDPAFSRILDLLEIEVAKRSQAEKRAFVADIAHALLMGGGLLALHVVLESAYGGD